MNVIRVNNSIFISQDYLVSQGVNANYLRVAKSRSGRLTDSWTHEIINNMCYFPYNSLPRSTTARLEDYETLNEKAVETHDYIADIIQTAKLYGFKAFLKSMSHDEAVSMAVIREAARYALENGISFRKSAFFKKLANEIRVQNLKYLPVSWQNLRDKIENYATQFSRTYKTLPNEIAAVAVNFSKERFVSQAWLDTTKENWKARKRPRKGTGSQTLLVKTGRLKRSIRKISADESQVIIGSDVPYAKIHNDGGIINKAVTIKTHTVREHSRTRKGRKETVKEHEVKSHIRKINITIPKRQFIGESYTLSKRIINLITARFMRALKS